MADNEGVYALSWGDFPMGEPLQRLCVPQILVGMTLECNTQRARLLRFALLFGPQGWEGKVKVGDGYNLIPITLLGMVLQLFLISLGEYSWACNIMSWILLMVLRASISGSAHAFRSGS